MDLIVPLKETIWFVSEEWKVVLLLTTIFSLYLYYASVYKFFERKGIHFMKPYPIVGNFGARLFATKSFHQFQYDIYQYFKGSPYGGTFEGRTPLLYLFDTELIKAVTMRDFDHFLDRHILRSNEPKYLSQSLLSLKGSKWKRIRSILTPVFSPARLKIMFPLIEMCSQQMIPFMRQNDGKDVEMKSAMGHLALEVIGACAFGIRFDSLTDENANFIKHDIKCHSNYINPRSTYGSPKRVHEVTQHLTCNAPDTSVRHHQSRSSDLHPAVPVLSKTNTSDKRNDFLQLLVDAAGNNNALDDDTIDAQALFFLTVGYDLPSTLLAFAIHVLATKPELQDKLRTHVQVLTQGKEIMSYEVLTQLTYLEAFLLETLRMYPPVALFSRRCCKKYTLPGTSVQLDVGDRVGIPVYGIHMDPDIYPDPEEFKPERFLGEEMRNRPSHLFLAFGVGPRNCIGVRYAMYSAKMSMVALLKNYKFSVCAKTQDPVKFDKRIFFLTSERGLWVRVDKL